MKRLAVGVAISVGLALAGTAAAGPYRGNGVEYDTARVVSVHPIIDQYEEPVPREVCRNEPVSYYEPEYAYEPRGSRDGTGGALLGAIIGGALGNQVGKGDGRRAATIAGAVIGGSIGHGRATRGGYREVGGRYRQDYERVCSTEVDYRRNERVVGYDVEYEYNGRVYHTQTDYHPGDRIKVEVSVNAVR